MPSQLGTTAFGRKRLVDSPQFDLVERPLSVKADVRPHKSVWHSLIQAWFTSGLPSNQERLFRFARIDNLISVARAFKPSSHFMPVQF
jgi:hypothetical protein